MSGIAGIIQFNQAQIKLGLIEKMTSSMSYRGPDGIHHWIKESVAMGHCMLHTTPESLTENQPLSNENETLVLVMDGRVDNWKELRKKLLNKSVVLRSRSDAELILRSYELWGQNCLDYIDGDFALVIWDARHKEVFCARDRMGNKPFHYYWDGNTFVFASELHAILKLPLVSKKLNNGVIAEHLAAEWYSCDETFWKGVLRLVAAHKMKVNASSGPRIEKYWSPDLWNILPYTKDEEYIEHYSELFKNTVKQLSRSHKPLAYEVSGGLDSSAIFATAEHLHQTQDLLANTIHGYTLDFHDDPDANELEYCRAVGAKSKKTIKEIQPSKMPLSWYQDRARFYRDIPQYPNGVMAFGLMKEASQDGCRVLFNGTGGDEWLSGGRNYYAEELASLQWKQLIRNFRSDYQDAGFLKSLWWLFRFGFAPLLPHPIKHLLRNADTEHENQSWLTPTLQTALKKQREKHHVTSTEKVRSLGQKNKLKYLSDSSIIQAHERQEGLCATIGLESRRPFWNAEMVQFSFDIPQRLLFKHGINKYTHRQAMSDLLPNQVLKRTTKAEFSTIYHRHFREMEILLTQDIPNRHPNWVDQKYSELLYSNAKNDGWSQWMLWGLFGCDAFTQEL